MAQLAIKGHATRGSEVIALLEMLGGNNANNCYGKYYHRVYYINENGYIDQDFIARIEYNKKFIIFDFEDFLEKFPYKVGDKVKNARINDFIGRITNARWDNNEEQIIYTVEWNDTTKSTLTYFARGLQPYKEESMETHKTQKEVNIYLQDITIKNAQNLLDIERHLNNDGLELPNNIVINKKGIDVFEFIKWYGKPQYPKNYEECCEVLDILGNINAEGYKKELLLSLQELLICRDAYWKIAGNWKPDWNNISDKHCIHVVGGDIWLKECQTRQVILAFPTAEMRDAFYENFKELIEQCKELL